VQELAFGVIRGSGESAAEDEIAEPVAERNGDRLR